MSSFSKLNNKMVLLIDDDALIRDALGMIFNHKGCELFAVDTAEKGLREINRRHFDIIISDFRLPGINGLEFFKLATAISQETIKILISAYQYEDINSEGSSLVLHDFIKKPFSPAEIIKSVERLLDSQEKGQCRRKF